MPPLFRYTWEGAFRFHSTKGMDWSGHDQSSWNLLEYVPPKELRGYTLGRRSLAKRAKALERHEDELRKELKMRDVALPPKLPFLRWLAYKEPEYKIADELSILLNHIALSQGLKVYEIVSTIVANCFSAELRGLADGEPCWVFGNNERAVPFVGEDVLVHAHLFMKPSRSGFSGFRPSEDIDKACSWIRSRRIVHKYEVISFRVDHSDNGNIVEIGVRDRACWLPYERGLRAAGLPIPGKAKKGKEPIASRSPEVCVASRTVRESLAKLSQIWQDRSVKAVLITAPPGSGKENFAKSIPYGLGRAPEDIPTRALSDDVAGDMAAIFGQKGSDGKVVDGLLRKAANKAVFIDEAHYPVEGTGVRSALLRPLENGEYSPLGSAEVISCSKTLFIFASSLPLRTPAGVGTGESSTKSALSLDALDPPDFWTRVTHHVPLPHPLDGLKDADLRDALVGFFRHFWWDRALEHFGVESFPFDDDDSRPAATTAVLKDHLSTMLGEETLLRVSTAYADAYNSYLKTKEMKVSDVSLRGIRSIVTRLFSDALNDLLRGHEVLATNRLKSRLEEHIGEVVPLAKLRVVTQ